MKKGCNFNGLLFCKKTPTYSAMIHALVWHDVDARWATGYDAERTDGDLRRTRAGKDGGSEGSHSKQFHSQ